MSLKLSVGLPPTTVRVSLMFGHVGVAKHLLTTNANENAYQYPRHWPRIGTSADARAHDQ